jgi:hypothetical protein
MGKGTFTRSLMILIPVISIGCSLLLEEENKPEPIAMGEIEVESFLEYRAIRVRWQENIQADEYVLQRAQDGINGVGPYTEVYRGRGTRYVDRKVEDDIRYVYRLDMIQKGNMHEGEQTGIGVGNSAEVDLNEPNNRMEEATALSSFKRGTMYYFRFSDGRELKDIDCYKVKVGGGKSVYLQIQEDGVRGMTTLRIEIGGKEAFLAEHGKWYELQNEAKIEREWYITIYPDVESYAAEGMTGGTIRKYTIIRSDIMVPDNGGNDGGGGTQPGNGDGGTDGGGTDSGGSIQEMSELFEQDETGRFIFFLNEQQYQGKSYTFWKYLNREWKAETGMSMELAKESGNYFGGYGFFFAGGNVAGYGESMLVLLIQKDGNYTIGKVVEGEYYEVIVPWENSVYLRKGYGVKNTVGVRWDSQSGFYIITLNGMDETRFRDTKAPVCTGSRVGIVAVLTSIEQFPQSAVKVGYK